MSKSVLSIALVIVAVAAPYLAPVALGVAAGSLAALAVTAAIEVGVALAGSVLLGPSVPKSSLTNTATSRLYATLVTTEPRKWWVGGPTAGGNDVRYQTYTGSKQEYYHQIIAHASHQVQSIDEIWVDNEKAWTKTGGVQGRYVGWLTVTTRELATSSNGIAIDSVWTASCTLTGCAYTYLQYKLIDTSNANNQSPFQSGISGRLTFRGKGAPIYDPRLDSTVTGGSGTQRAGTQSTWAWSDTASRNPALQLLWYLLGWQINGKIALGMGLPPARIDLASFITAANHCDESVTLAGGGSEPRYRSDGLISEGDDRSAVVQHLCQTMNATLRDSGGKIALQVISNDLATPVATFGLNDILGSEQYDQTQPLNNYFNIARGRRVDPSDQALYQLTDFPQVVLTSPDGIDRIQTTDYPLVQSNGQAQRIAKLNLKRAQYQAKYTATFGANAWAVSLGNIVQLNHSGMNWTNKLFRVVAQAISQNGQVKMTLLEESTDVYSWAAEDIAGTVGGTPTAVVPTSLPIPSAIVNAGTTATWPNITGTGKPSDNATVGAVSGPGGNLTGAVDPNGRPYVDFSQPTGHVSPGLVNNSNVPTGANAVVNSEFTLIDPTYSTTYPAGFQSGWTGNNTPGPSVVDARVTLADGSYAMGRTCTGAMTSGNSVDCTIAIINSGYSRRYLMPIAPGDTISASYLVAHQNCSGAFVDVQLLDEAFAYVGEFAGTSVVYDIGAAAFTTISRKDMALSTGTWLIKPDGDASLLNTKRCRWAAINCRFVSNGTANPRLLAAAPMLCKIPAGQTAVPPYMPGPADRAATFGAYTGPGGNIYGDIDPNGRPNIDFGQTHYAKNLDNINGATVTYDRVLKTKLNANRPVIDLADGIHQNVDAGHIYYGAGGGGLIETFKPAEPGAEKTTGKSIDILIDGSTFGRVNNTALTNNNIDMAKNGVVGKSIELVRNPNFESGWRDWYSDAGIWTVVNDGNAYDGSYAAKYATTGAVDAMRSSVVFAVSQGDNVLASCMIKRTAGTGSAYLRIDFLNAAKTTEIAQALAPAITSATYAPSRVVGVAPAGAAFARIEVVGQGASGTVCYVDQVNCALMPNTVDEVPDGATYGRPLATRLNANRPTIDFSEAIHANKTLDNIADGATYGALPLANITGTGTAKRALIDFTQAHVGKSLANVDATASTKLGGIAAGATVGADWASNLTSKPTELTDGRVAAGLNSGGFIDFSRAHVGKSLANVDSTANTKLGGIATGATVGADPSNLVLGSTLNINRDPNYATPAAWSLNGSNSYFTYAYVTDQNALDLNTDKAVYFSATGVAVSGQQYPYFQQTKPIQVTGGEVFLFTIPWKRVGAVSHTMIFQVRCWINDGTTTFPDVTVVAATAATDTVLGTTTYRFVVPINAIKIEPNFQWPVPTGQTPSWNIYVGKWSGVQVTRLGATLVAEDGTTLLTDALARNDLQQFSQVQGSISLTDARITGKTLDNIADGTSYVSLPAANVTGSGATKRALIDFTQGHVGKSLANVDATANTKLDGIAAGATVGADWGSNLTSRPTELTDGRVATGLNSGGYIDFSRAHTGKNLDNIPNGSTYGGTLLTRLNAGKPVVDFSENIHANQNLVNNSNVPTGQNAVVNSEFTLIDPAYSTTYPAGFQSAWLGNNVPQPAVVDARVTLADGSYAMGRTCTGAMTSGNVVDCVIALTGPNSPRYLMPIAPGDNIAASFLIAHQNCTGGYVNVQLFDDAFHYVGEFSGSTVAHDIAAAAFTTISRKDMALSTGTWLIKPDGDASLSNTKRCRWAAINCHFTSNGTANPRLLAAAPMLCKIPAGQTAVPPYNPGPADRNATFGAYTGPGGNLYGDTDLNGRPNIDFGQTHYAKNLDNIDGANVTYDRVLKTKLNAGRPTIDLADGIHLNVDSGHIKYADGTTTLETLKPAEGAAEKTTGKSIDILTGANVTYDRVLKTRVDAGRVKVDFNDTNGGSSIHSNIGLVFNSNVGAYAALGDANRVRFSLFERGVIGWNNGENSGVTSTSTASAPSGGISYFSSTGTFTANSQTLDIGTDTGRPDCTYTCAAGEYLFVSGILSITSPFAAAGCTWTYQVGWLNSAGTEILSPGRSTVASGSGQPNGSRYGTVVQAPTGATSCFLRFNASNGTAGAIGAVTMYLGQPFICSAGANQTAGPAFSPGPSSDGGATVGARSGIGGNLTGDIDPNGRPYIDFGQTHYAKNLDNIDGATVTYDRVLKTKLNANRPVIDLSDGIHANVDAVHIKYGDGTTTLETLKPAQANADATAGKSIDILLDGATYGRVNNTALTNNNIDMAKSGVVGKSIELVRNPNFESGWRDWYSDAGIWTVVNDGNAYDGSYAAKYATTGAVDAMRSSVVFAVSQGDNVLASCMIKRTAGTGSAYLRIDFLNAAKTTEIAQALAPAITSATYAPSRVVGVAPAGAAFARIEVVGQGASGTVCYVDQVNCALMPNTVDEVPDGATYGRPLASQLTNGQHKLEIGASGHMLGDGLQVPPVIGAGSRYFYSQSPSYGSTTTTASTITLAAGTLTVGGRTVSYPSYTANVNGSSGASITFYVFGDDLTYSGALSGGLQTSTDATARYSGTGRIYFGSVTIVFNVGTSGGGGGAGCVTVDTHLPFFGKAGGVEVDNKLLISNPVTFAERMGRVSYAERKVAQCVRITTDSGIQLECSLTAPIAVEGGEQVLAPDLLGRRVPVRDFGDYRIEEVTEVEHIGEREIIHITCENDFFLAGKRPGRYILHHNLKP